MNGIREYLLSVSSAAILCTLIAALVGEKSFGGKIIKLLAGIFLATVMLKPTIQLKLSDWKYFETDLLEKSSEAVEEGQRLALETLSEQAALSAQRCIEEEAEKLGCQLDVTVIWEDQVPKEITLTGSVSPYAKTAIANWITENMGLSREAQIWIG